MSDTGDTADTEAGAAAAKASPSDEVSDAMAKLMSAYQQVAAKGGSTPEITDAVTQALVMILGSGPSIAAYQSLLQSQAASGMMYQNAVANQQKTNILGMAMTAKCVRYMLDPHMDDDAIEDVLHEAKP